MITRSAQVLSLAGFCCHSRLKIPSTVELVLMINIIVHIAQDDAFRAKEKWGLHQFMTWSKVSLTTCGCRYQCSRQERNGLLLTETFFDHSER